ncbi:high affinity immunoglobulin gamma Fc receptor I-like [Clarias magur]|nr:high affinity immunoglobulin gamma Fc receptor I-like [Clarias magur]
MTLTCRVRDDPRLLDVVFYKNEAEVMQGQDKHHLYPNVTLKDNDVYSCRATWFKNQEYQSGQSVPSPVIVLDKLETPRIEFSTTRGLARSGDSVDLRCITKLNTREQDLSLEYYFFKDDSRMGPVSAKDTHTIFRVRQEDAGSYSCKVRVRALNVERWSNQIRLKVLPPLQL